MNRAQAITRLGKIIGKNFAYRVDNKAPVCEQRQTMLEAWKAATAELQQAIEARAARKRELLRSDAEYQRLKAEHKLALEKRDKASHGLHNYRITVGRDGGMFFSVVATGDNWAEVVEKVCNKEHV